MGSCQASRFALTRSEHIVCPICEVPVDRALADGCNLSHKLPDLDEAKQKMATTRAGSGHGNRTGSKESSVGAKPDSPGTGAGAQR